VGVTRPGLVAAAVLAVLVLGGVGVLVAGSRGGADPAVGLVRVGVGAEPESVLLGHVMVALLEDAGIPAEIVPFGQTRDARQAVALGEADIAPSYTGAVWLDELGWSDPPGDTAVSYDRIRAADARRSLVWVAASRANATLAFVVPDRSDGAPAPETLEDLALVVNTDRSARLCVDPDIAERPDGLPSVARLYSISDEVLAGQVLPMAPEDAVAGVVGGTCVAGLTTATDGQAAAAGLRPLADPFGSFPAFVVGVVGHEDRMERPVEEALAPLTALSTEALAAWNGQVVTGDDLPGVARTAAAWLRERTPADGPPSG
jgi:glycine betaine/choline ABC-type transport system substrate-binding protein